MAAAVDDGQLLKQATGRNTRGLLRVIILCLIAAAAVSSRLFSVIRFESIIHECQYDNWRAKGQLTDYAMQLIRGSTSERRNTWYRMASIASGTGSMTVRTAPAAYSNT
jgi:dolichyl-diphosphooligosaccharide--protein glycosyltransferase